MPGPVDRDIETTFTDEQGKCLISRSAVSEVTETLWEEYLAFSKRDLSGFEVAYIFLDAVYEPMRMFKGPKEGILCAWAILVTGRKCCCTWIWATRKATAAGLIS